MDERVSEMRARERHQRTRCDSLEITSNSACLDQLGGSRLVGLVGWGLRGLNGEWLGIDLMATIKDEKRKQQIYEGDMHRRMICRCMNE